MTAKKDLHPDDEIVTMSEDGKSAETKKAPTEDELKAARAKESDDDSDEGDEDERHAVGSGESAEDAESRKAARRDARKARKNHRREREERTAAENADLRERLAVLEGRVTRVDQTSATQTIAIVDQRISEASQARELADAALEVAITKQDGKSAREAIKARDLAVEALRQLDMYKRAYTENAKNQPQGPQGPNPVLVGYARQFKADNPWINLDPASSDDDSKAVHRLDASVKAAGYDPATPEYWEELQDRVDRKFPNKLAAAGDDDDGDTGDAGGTRRAAQQSRSESAGRRGPSMSGGRSAANIGKNDVVVPKEVREAAMSAGYWNDPKDRADFLKRWKASKDKYSAAR